MPAVELSNQVSGSGDSFRLTRTWIPTARLLNRILIIFNRNDSHLVDLDYVCHT